VDESQRSDLSASLSDLAGFPVELQVVIEPSLLSGAVIQIGDLQVDATARARLDALREHLAPGGWDDKLIGSGQGPTNGTTTEGAA
jgi:F-type H+-transporting ATPase subunit delta